VILATIAKIKFQLILNIVFGYFSTNPLLWIINSITIFTNHLKTTVMKMKIASSNFLSILTVLAVVSAFTLGCNSQNSSADKANDQLIQAGNDLLTETETDTIFYNSGSGFTGPVPEPGTGPTTDTLRMGCIIGTRRPLAAKGPSLAAAVDSVTFVTKIQSNGGLNLTEVIESGFNCVALCSNGIANPFSVTHGDWTFVPESDSTAVISNCTLDISNPDCSDPSLEIQGNLVVILTEGMPEDPGVASVFNVTAWKNGAPIPTVFVPYP
jgi:hypothetical protein